ncbi:hypothetical protein OH77DRAFT_1419960 [Trametes cingulata]|nr:hypothetical protein OH77DRAFT_1419960 [Trametes cingulata]
MVEQWPQESRGRHAGKAAGSVWSPRQQSDRRQPKHLPVTLGEAVASKGERTARAGIYRHLEARLPFQLTAGGMSHFYPLRRGSWVVVYKMDKLYLGQVRVLYVKGGGLRPTHNYADSCEEIGKLSRLVVLVYAVLGDTVLSPLSASPSGSPAPDSATFLYLHQESLVTSLDAYCPNPVQSTIPLQPGLSMLTVSNKLTTAFQQLETHIGTIRTAVDGLLAQARKRNKRAGEAGESAAGATDNSPSESKRLRE